MTDRHADLVREATDLDRDDPLGHWRDEFHIVDPDLVYLDGNSLGIPPKRTLGRVGEVIAEEWAGGLIRSWGHWVDLPRQVGDLLAPLIGARPGEVIVHDSTTINLYQLVRAALRLRPDRRALAVAPVDFPTDRYVVGAIADHDGLEVRAGFDDLDDVAVAVRSMVDYRTAEVVDVAAETRRARDAGALVVWDLSHAAGLIPVGLGDAGVDLAVGCTYKFLHSGPGGPGFSYVSEDLIGRIDEPFHGWFGRTDRFSMGADFEPLDDIGRLLAGTPGILGLVAARCGIELTAEAGVDEIRSKSIALGRFGLRCCDDLGLVTSTPRDDRRRGGHLCVHHPDARTVTERLASEHGVIVDFREPDVVRLGCSPLTTRFSDVATALVAIRTLTS